MKFKNIIITIACLITLCACSTETRSQSELLPYPIDDVTYAAAAYDGGSILICFVLEDGSEWRLKMNNSISDKNNPDIYKALNLIHVGDSQWMMLKKGSKEESDILILLSEYKKSNRRVDKEIIYWIDSLLKEKRSSNQNLEPIVPTPVD